MPEGWFFTNGGRDFTAKLLKSLNDIADVRNAVAKDVFLMLLKDKDTIVDANGEIVRDVRQAARNAHEIAHIFMEERTK